MIDRFSLRWKVPAIIALILVGSVIALGALAYDAARRSALESARARLVHAAGQISQVGTAAMTNLERQAQLVTSDSALIEALRHPGQPLSAGAQEALQRLRPNPASLVEVAVVDVNGRPVEGVAPELVREAPIGDFTPVDSLTVSPFRMVDGMLEYTVAAPIRDNGRLVGQLLQWRRVARGPVSLELIESLIGDSAILLIGNSDESLAVEFLDTLQTPVVRDSARARQARLSHTRVVAPIEGSPWAFFIEYRNAHILEPIRLLSWKVGVVALLVVVVAILAGVLLSRGMTSALSDLTTTAEYIAGGDLKRRPLETRRQDELGRLARSFSAMADKVSESTEQLERRIADRTADLQNAMTRLRETQDELVRKERLATMGQLASSVGHELRNPLGVMSNSVYLLERTLDSPAPKAQQYLALLRTQIKLSERIVSDLLDSARNPSPQRKQVDVHPFLKEQIERVAMPPNVTLEVSVADRLPLMHVDPDQIGQILVNLVTNGVQSIGPHPGTLSVRARNGAGRIHIDVRDTGPGVPVELVDKIFEPLFTTKARGIGLGLSVSRSLAIANQGSLTVANHVDGGAVFTLDLPAGPIA